MYQKTFTMCVCVAVYASEMKYSIRVAYNRTFDVYKKCDNKLTEKNIISRGCFDRIKVILFQSMKRHCLKKRIKTLGIFEVQ